MTNCYSEIIGIRLLWLRNDRTGAGRSPREQLPDDLEEGLSLDGLAHEPQIRVLRKVPHGRGGIARKEHRFESRAGLLVLDEKDAGVASELPCTLSCAQCGECLLSHGRRPV